MIRTKESAHAGAGIVLNKNAKNALHQWGSQGERIAWADFKMEEQKKLRIIAAYAPTATPDKKEETRVFYEELSALRAQTGRTIILGDMNARLVRGIDNIFHYNKVMALI